MKTIMTAGAALLMTTSIAAAGGLDRSGQGVGVIFEDGEYAELSFGIVMPSVTGSITPPGLNSGNVAPDYTRLGAAYRTQLNDDFAIALIFDQPFGASVDYGERDAGYPVSATAELNSSSITAVGQYQINERVSVHAGPRLVSLDATLVNPAGSSPVEFASDSGLGFVVGGAYEIPDIALRAALTYSSEIDMSHTTTTGGGAIDLGPTEYTLPQSINLDFQTGVAEGTLLLASVRWAEWTTTSINVGSTPNNLINYDNDVFSYSLGVARRFNESFAGVVTVSYEKSNGGEASNLAPTDGSLGITLGGVYTMDDVTFTGGINYTMVGDATAELTGAQFTDNSAVGIGFKVGYSF